MVDELCRLLAVEATATAFVLPPKDMLDATHAVGHVDFATAWI